MPVQLVNLKTAGAVYRTAINESLDPRALQLVSVINALESITANGDVGIKDNTAAPLRSESTSADLVTYLTAVIATLS
jgi:hypothetical protein